MTPNSYDIIYLISNAFGTYTLFKFMNVFFDRKDTNRKIEVLSYFTCFVITDVVYLLFKSQGINIALNLIMFFFITYIYTAKTKRLLLEVILIYVILLLVEVGFVFFIRIFELNDLMKDIDLELIVEAIGTKIVFFIMVLILSNLKKVKKSVELILKEWIVVFIIPLGIVGVMVVVIQKIQTSNILPIFSGILILFLIIVFVFYLYDAQLSTYEEQVEKQILSQQNMAYIKQFELIHQSQENTQILRHDMKNHLLIIEGLIEKGDNQEALSYIKETFDFIRSKGAHANTGNMGIDSILNYKIDHGKRLGIEFHLNLTVPAQLDIEAFDLGVILGNLMDNAIEAVSKEKENKVIDVSIVFNKNILYITISNPFDGTLRYERDRIKTTKEDSSNHGMGLLSIKKSVDKYDGIIEMEAKDNIFSISVSIYNKNR